MFFNVKNNKYKIKKITINDTDLIYDYLINNNYYDFLIDREYIKKHIEKGDYSNSYKIFKNDSVICTIIYHDMIDKYPVLSLHFNDKDKYLISMKFGYSLSMYLYPNGWFVFTKNLFIKTYIEKRLKGLFIKKYNDEFLFFVNSCYKKILKVYYD